MYRTGPVDCAAFAVTCAILPPPIAVTAPVVRRGMDTLVNSDRLRIYTNKHEKRAYALQHVSSRYIIPFSRWRNFANGLQTVGAVCDESSMLMWSSMYGGFSSLLRLTSAVGRQP